MSGAVRGAVRFAHVALNCRDMAVTEAYYTRHFGFRRVRVLPLGDGQIVFLRLADAWLELFAAEGEAPAAEADGPRTPGMRHLAFSVDDVDAQLAAMGEEAVVTLGPLDFDDFIPGWRTVWLRDPDGTIVEVTQGYADQDDPPRAAA